MSCHIDYETYSEADIKKVGAARYAADPTTEVLSCAYCISDGPITLWEKHEGPMPPGLEDILAGKFGKVNAFNALFEMEITERVLGIPVEEEMWVDTAVEAYYFAFSGSLDDVAEQMELGVAKNADGKKLIHKFSKPQPKNHKVRRWTHENSTTLWRDFMQYNKQDVEVERQVHFKVQEWGGVPEFIYDEWVRDMKINRRGLPIDMKLVEEALVLSDMAKAGLTQQLKDLTGLANPNSRNQMLAWLNGQGVEVDNLQAATVEGILSDLS